MTNSNPRPAWLVPVLIIGGSAVPLLLLLVTVGVMAMLRNMGQETAPEDAQTAAAIKSQATSQGESQQPNSKYEIEKLVLDNNIAGIEKLMVAKGDRETCAQLSRLATGNKRPEILRAVIRFAKYKLSPVDRDALERSWRGLIHLGDSHFPMVLIEEGIALDRDAVEQRLILAVQNVETQLVDTIYEYLDGGITTSSWREILRCPKSDEDWKKWIERLESQIGDWKPSVVQQAANSLTHDVDLGGKTPGWWPLVKYFSKVQMEGLARDSIYRKWRPVFLQLLEEGMPETVCNESYLGMVQAWDLELWKQWVSAGSQELKVMAWWGNLRGQDPLGSVQQWGELVGSVINSTPPRTSGRDQYDSYVEYALSRSDYELARWLLDRGAIHPSNLKHMHHQCFLAIYDGNVSELNRLLYMVAGKKITSSASPIEFTDSDRVSVNKFFKRSPTNPAFDPLKLAIELNQADILEALLVRMSVEDASDLLDAALAAERWDCIQAMVAADIKVPEDALAQLFRADPNKAKLVLPASAHSQTLGRTFPTRILDDVNRKDLDRLEADLESLAEYSEEMCRRNPQSAPSMEKLFNSLQSNNAQRISTDQIVRAALAEPEFLRRLQIEGFPLRKTHVLEAIRLQNLESVKICCSSLLLMRLGPSDYEDISSLAKLCNSSDIAEYVESLGLH